MERRQKVDNFGRLLHLCVSSAFTSSANIFLFTFAKSRAMVEISSRIIGMREGTKTNSLVWKDYNTKTQSRKKQPVTRTLP